MKKLIIAICLISLSFTGFSQESGKGQDHAVETTREAHYEGGDQEFITSFYKIMKYSQEAIDARVEGQVLVSFLVKKDGTVDPDRIRVFKDLGYGITEAIKKTIAEMTFVPALENGFPVDREIMYNIPIRAH